MTHTTHTLRLAGSAIAAALALASTPSLAQDAAAPFPTAPNPLPAPVIVVPDVPVPAAPEPTIVLPTETVQPLPVPEPTAETAEPVPTATTTRTRVTASAAERSVATPEPAPQPAASEPAEPTALPLPPVAAEPVAEEQLPPLAADEPAPATADFDSGILALILGALAFLALAIWGFIAIGRRKPVRRYVAERPVAKPAPVVPHTVEPAPVVAREQVASEPVRPLATPFAPRPASASGLLPHAGASVALPARMPEDYAERDALLKAMIAAKPDRANPFTDRGARTRRARLILQSLGRDFGEVEPWIDLSQYPHNWPELARRNRAAA